MNHEEHRIQATLIKEVRRLQSVLPELSCLYAIPNGEKRNIITAKRLKAEGVLSGVPDLCLPVSDGVFNALYIEMKRPGGKTSNAQKAMGRRLELYGNLVVVCYSATEAINELLKFIQRGRNARKRKNNA